jgi:HEAT repeat protein
MGGAESVRAMRALLEGGDPSVRAFAALGLGQARDATSAEALSTLLRTDRSVFVQAAAAWALGRIGRDGDVPGLIVALRGSGGVLAIAAADALGRVGEASGTEALAVALFDLDPREREAAARALVRLHDGEERGRAEALPVLDPEATAAAYVAALIGENEPIPETPVDFHALRAPLLGAAKETLRGPAERARAGLSLLTDGDDASHVSFGPLTRAVSRWPEPLRARAVAELVAISAALVPDLLFVADHPDPAIRAQAMSVLGRIDDGDAAARVALALEDDEPAVQRAALLVLGTHARVEDEAVTDRVGAILASHPDWAVRTLAARTLGRVSGRRAESHLVRALTRDEYAFVREAAAAALGEVGGTAAERALEEAAGSDREERVRRAARAALRR